MRTYNWAQVGPVLSLLLCRQIFSLCFSFSLLTDFSLCSQGRVTDHRINLTINNLDAVLEGDGLGLITDALKKNHDAAVMEDLLET